MVTPAWVITGFLDSGKTTLMNRLIEEELEEQEILAILFENGDIPLTQNGQVRRLVYSKDRLEEAPFEIAESIRDSLMDNPVDLVIIEWNGMEHFHKLEEMLLQFSMKPVLSIEKVIYAAEEDRLRGRISDAGAISMSQIAASDCAYLRVGETEQISGEGKALFDINPDIHIFTGGKWERFAKRLFRYDIKPQMWLLSAVVLTVLYLAVMPALGQSGFSFQAFFTVFLGVFLQAVPFLAIGVLLSSAIQVYVQPEWIQRKFPKQVIAGQLFAIVAGFCLPVCDCASIPVFKSLVKKGVPMPAAVTFMLVSPVINPVVILSTWYAFNGNVRMIAARCGLGVLCAVLSGLTCLVCPPKKVLLTDDARHPVNAGGLRSGADLMQGQAGGCRVYDDPAGNPERSSRFFMMMRHAQNEFFAVGKYLLTGIFVSTVFQDMQPAMIRSGAGIPLAASILFMMAMAFVLSLCSSSDAVVARSMAGVFPVGALMGFLVFGPMMDIKNIAMLLGGFRAKFAARLLVTAFLICFVAVLMFASLGSGGIRI
ncbi:permease [Clostridium sp. Marseille-P2415]|uniref:permease n=1 Tax=Clostridium sp. Marseille-P2415 TaxID=1805471 RepID=UPI000988770F|nr:permease [Clostridium sp. Marseille-P2415]